MKTRFLIALSIVVIIGAAVSCTVAPKPIQQSGISWDGNQQNGGFLGFSTNSLPMITPTARVRYNALIDLQPAFKKNGLSFPVVIQRDDGIRPMTNGNFEISYEGFQHFSTLERWFKQGKAR